MAGNSIRLISNNICYGPAPDAHDEVEQYLTISSSGRVWFSARNYEQYINHRGFCRQKQVNIGTWKTNFLLRILGTIDEKPMVTDCGSYEMILRHADGNKKYLYGSLVDDTGKSYGKTISLSRLVRRYIPIHSLWAFDGSLSPDYEGKKAIHLFAKKWEELFESNGQDKLEDDFAQYFGDECMTLGFQMDTGEEISIRYPGSFDMHNPNMDAIISSIKDVDLLGSALFSKWRYLTHWAYMYQLNEEYRHWFLLLMKQMKYLTKKKDSQ